MRFPQLYKASPGITHIPVSLLKGYEGGPPRPRSGYELLDQEDSGFVVVSEQTPQLKLASQNQQDELGQLHFCIVHNFNGILDRNLILNVQASFGILYTGTP